MVVICLADDVAEMRLARAHGDTVDMHGAGAAKAAAAAEFRAGHLEMFADDPEQRRAVGRVHGLADDR